MCVSVLRLLRLLRLWGLVGVWLAQAQAAAPPPPTLDLSRQTQACTHCHGDQGRAGPDGYYPRLAGKPQAYLHHQLLNFRDGRRSYPPMRHLLSTLDDPFLWQLAGFFAQQHPPHPAPLPPHDPPSALAVGQRLAQQGDASRQLPACVQCHGQALGGQLPAVPGLLGLPKDYLVAQLGAWRTGQRHSHAPDCMAPIARALRPNEVAALAAWLASQPVPEGSRPEAAPTRSSHPVAGCAPALGVRR